jgi:hypothetical protein
MDYFNENSATEHFLNYNVFNESTRVSGFAVHSGYNDIVTSRMTFQFSVGLSVDDVEIDLCASNLPSNIFALLIRCIRPSFNENSYAVCRVIEFAKLFVSRSSYIPF